VTDARAEESRLLEEIKSWVTQKVGAAALAPAGVDASSRGYIFQQKILPELQRDVDRSMESLGSFGQFALVYPPIRVPTTRGQIPNPLLTSRQYILSLKGLRARLTAENVMAFAVTPTDQALVQRMDRRIAEVMQVSNITEAASARTAAGYAAARRNVELLAAEAEAAMAAEGSQDPAHGAFLFGLLVRYRALAELCRVCEELTSPNGISGAAIASRVTAIAGELARASQAIEASNFSPADTMPMVIGTNQEAVAARLLVRWLGCYDAMTSRNPIPFYAFTAEVDAVSGGGQVDALTQGDLLEGLTFVVRAVHGEVATSVINDYAWVTSFAESGRSRKTMGLFGVEESVLQVDQFLTPVWIADVSYSRATGAVFKAGVEGRGVAIVEACSPAAAKVAFFPDPNLPLVQALGYQQTLGTTAVALPRCTAAGVHSIFAQALQGRADITNPQVRVRNMAFLPAAVVHYQSDKGMRQQLGCMGGQIAIDATALQQVTATQQLLQRFG
jgi:hypothetical protein